MTRFFPVQGGFINVFFPGTARVPVSPEGQVVFDISGTQALKISFPDGLICMLKHLTGLAKKKLKRLALVMFFNNIPGVFP
jgi:hypothetical protein